MKRALILAAIAALILPDIAAAQMAGPRPDRPGDNRPGRPGNDRPGRPGDNRPGRPGDNRPGPDRPRPPGPGMRPPQFGPPAMRPPQRPPQWSWRGRNYSRIRGPVFRYPPGYAYRRWTVGALLPGLLLSPSYFYDGWGGIGLGAPGPRRRWVRYGPDLLLVNTRTRRVEDIIYDAFY